MPNFNCKDADDGRSDFLAGKKDEARYNDASGGADYRRGWQLARLGAVADQPKPEPNPQTFAPAPLSDDPPWDDAPVVAENSPKAADLPDVRLASIKTGTPASERQEQGNPPKPATAGQLDLF